MPINILIIEDDLIIAENLKENLESLNYKVVGIATNYKEAVNCFDSTKADLCLVDIHLKNSSKNGIEIMQYLKVGERIPIIYLTSFSDRAYRDLAKATNPAAYLMKPASKSQVDIAIEMAINNFRKTKSKSFGEEFTDQCPFVTRQGYFFVKVKERYEKINTKDIVYVMAGGAYCKIFTSNKEYTVSAALKSFLQQLNTSDVMRCHRSYAVHMHKIQAFDEHNLFLVHQEQVREIPWSNQYKTRFKAFLPKIKAT